MNDEKERYICIEVGGQNENVWRKMQSKLVTAINEFIDTAIYRENNTTSREEAKRFTDLLFDNGKNKLQKSGLDNEKLFAEVQASYSQAQLNLAEARVKNAEADALEFANAVRKMLLMLKMTKIIVAGQEGQEEFIFIKQIDEYIAIIHSLQNEQKQIPK